MNLIFQAALNLVLPGIPNVLEADLARDSAVGPLLLEAAALPSGALPVEKILRTLSMSIGQAKMCPFEICN